MRILKSYRFHDLLTLNIIRDKHTLFDHYLDALFAYYEVRPREHADLEIVIADFQPDLKNCFWVDGKYAVKQDFIFYESRYKAARWKMAVHGLKRDHTRVEIASNLAARMVFSGETLLSLVRCKLAQKGYAMLHASGIGINDQGFCFAARGGVGKTITAIRSIRQGAKLYGDDTVLLGSQGQMFGFVVPFNLRFTYDVEQMLGIRFPVRLRAEIFLKRLLSWATLGRYRLFTSLLPWRVFPEALGKSVWIEKIFLMLRGENFEVREAFDREAFIDQLMHVIRFESSELISLLQAYAHIFPDSAAGNFWDDYRAMLRSHLQETRLFQLTMPKLYQPDYFDSLWRELAPCEPSLTTSTI